MADQESQSVLRRKADAGTQEHQARAMTVAKAMRLGIARVADALMDLPLSAIGIVVERREADACADLMTEGSLLMLLDAPRGRIGAAILSADLAGGLIQQQTMGSVRPPAGEARAMTNTDAALAAPLIDGLLERAEREVEALGDRAVLEGVRFGSRAEEPRMVQMALEAPDFLVIRLTLDMAKGARQGELTLLLPPAPARGGPTNEDDTEGDDTSGTPHESEVAENRTAFTDLVFGLKAYLKMELCKLKMPLADATHMAVGDVLELPPGAFPSARVLAPDGRCVGTGTIGQVDGIRALRLDPKPIYASAPRRRASDQDDLDLPEVQPLEDQDIAQIENDAPVAVPHLPDMSDLADPPDLPELPDIPDLPDFPDLEPEEARAAPIDVDLPDLDDLPDLADLPELAAVREA
ncbi:MAG: FliM/FliN family flagellar motor switch protein [Pseudomonadota bacterium]